MENNTGLFGTLKAKLEKANILLMGSYDEMEKTGVKKEFDEKVVELKEKAKVKKEELSKKIAEKIAEKKS